MDCNPGTKNILLTGRPGVGKTAVIIKLAELMMVRKVASFYVEEIRKARQRKGFRIRTFSGEVAVLPTLYFHRMFTWLSAAEAATARSSLPTSIHGPCLFQGKPRIFYPDFTLPDVGVVVEYAAMRGHQDYERIMARKMRFYREAAVPVIVVEPEHLEQDWPQSLLGRIEQVCQERYSRLRQVAINYMRNTSTYEKPAVVNQVTSLRVPPYSSNGPEAPRQPTHSTGYARS